MGVGTFLQDSLADRLRNYGTAVCVGVFIGAALTTGVAAGVASWWATSELGGPLQELTARFARVAATTEARLLGEGRPLSSAVGCPPTAATESGMELKGDAHVLEEALLALAARVAHLEQKVGS